MSAQSTTKICRPELPSDRRNMMGREPSNRRKVKGIHGDNQRGDRIREGKLIKEMHRALWGVIKRRL
jgi:hypothetical protein